MQQKRVIDAIPERVRLEVKDGNIFKQVVVEQGGTLKEFDAKDLTAPQMRYVRAAKIFHEQIKDLNETQKQELIKYITQKCVLIYLSADSFEQAFRLFEIVNDRGKQLRRIDVLKSINISPDVVSSDTARDRIAQQWEAVENEVGESVFESVFYLIRLILLKDKPKGDLLKEFEDRVFSKKIEEKGEKFAQLVFDYVRLYRDIFVDKTFLDEEEKPHIKYQAIIHIMDREFQASEWRACVLYFAKKFKRNKFYEFCLAIEKLFLSQWVGGVRKDERYADYSRILAMIEKERDAAKIVTSIEYDETAIIDGVSRKDVYNAGFCKYALLRLELLASEHEFKKSIDAKSIEHVFPQKPAPESNWLKSAGTEELSEFVNSIGNLVLISKSRNSSASNYEFAEKKKRYLRPRVTDFPRSVQILDYDNWTPDTIRKRTEEVRRIFLDDI